MVRVERMVPACSIPPGCSTLGDNDHIELIPGFTSRLVPSEGLFHGCARRPAAALAVRVAESTRKVASYGDGITIWDRFRSKFVRVKVTGQDKMGLRYSG